MSLYKLWCVVQRDNQPFPVIINAPLTTSIAELKEEIKKKKSNLLQGIDPSSLNLWKVRYS